MMVTTAAPQLTPSENKQAASPPITSDKTMPSKNNMTFNIDQFSAELQDRILDQLGNVEDQDLSDLLTDILVASYNLNDQIKNRKVNLSDRMICSHCNTKLHRVTYNGYYDSFDYWDCACEDGAVAIEHKHRGSYG